MVRMWMVNPKILCRSHLLGEHFEHHKLVKKLEKKMSLAKYIENNCIELSSVKERHNLLVAEMLSRGYNHKSPERVEDFTVPDITYLPLEHRIYQIDVPKNMMLLFQRCSKCKERFDKMMEARKK